MLNYMLIFSMETVISVYHISSRKKRRRRMCGDANIYTGCRRKKSPEIFSMTDFWSEISRNGLVDVLIVTYTIRTEIYREMERLRTFGCAFVIPVVALCRLGRRKLAGAGASFWEDDQLTAGQLGFQRLAVPGPPNEIIVLQVVALDLPTLSLANDHRPRIRHFYQEREKKD